MNKICVYTCITGDYDDLKEIEHKEKGIDYYCFTNNKMIQSNTWKVIYIEDNKLSNHILSRKIKILGHELINDYDIQVWMDASVVFKKNIIDFINKYYNEDIAPFSAFKHEKRNCIYEEARECIKLGKDSLESVEKQIKFLEENKYPKNNGLCEMTVFIRNPKDKLVKETMKLWFNIVSNYSKRDQLSFNYCVYKTGMKINIINEKVFSNDWFIWKKHNSIFNNKYKLYYDYGNGFSEENCVEKSYRSKSETKSIKINVPDGCIRVRIDPTDKDLMYIKDLKLDKDLKLSYFNLIKHGDYYLFLNDDPSFTIDVENTSEFTVYYKLFENNDAINKKIISILYSENMKKDEENKTLRSKNNIVNNQLNDTKNRLNTIYNSKSWKLTKPFRVLLRKLKG